MSLDPLLLTKDLTDSERLMFQNEFNAVRKNPTTAVLLALLVGGLGAHHFYMGNILIGVLYLLFVWTFIPLVLSLIECFLMSSRVSKHNAEQANEIITKIKALRR